MARRDKLIQKMLKKPPEMRFEEVELVLKQHGFYSTTKGPSHRVYKNDQGQRVTIAIKGGQIVKREYLKVIIDLLQLED